MRVFRCATIVVVLATLGLAQNNETFQEPHRFLSAHGRKAWIAGYSNSGLEVWTGALQIADEIRPEFRRPGDASAIPGSQIVGRVDSSPSHVSRTYAGPDFVVEEELWVPLDGKAVQIRYRVRSARPVDVVVRFRPSLNLMWPAALGGQDIRWDAKHSGYILTDSARQFAAVVLAPEAQAHDETLNVTRSASGNDELAIVLGRKSPELFFAEIAPKAGSGGDWDAEIESLTQVLSSTAWRQEIYQHQEALSSSELKIETPDAKVNYALASAAVALDQDWFCNDRLGCGFVAGYGPSRRGRRPQYAWYFAGDGMIDLHAALAAGDVEHAREEIRFIAKYQDKKTGMIWHELSQSAPYLDWRGKYPYMFVHADLTYPYVSTVADYVHATGDREFLKEIWPSVQLAFGYGRSMIGDKALPEIPEGQEGANEQNPLREELGLSADWIEACGDYAGLAEMMGDHNAAREANSMAQKARASFEARYWDTGKNFAIQGFRRDGTAVADRGLGAISAASSGLFKASQSSAVLDTISTWRFQSDWGTRSVAVGEPGYNPTIYASGSVWALATAQVARAFWAEHRPETAWQIWRTLIPWSTLDSPGHMHEVLAGDTYHPQFESVPEQAWSSAGFLSAVIHGLLGLDVNGEAGTLTFAPHLPSDWDHVSVDHLRMGDSSLSLRLEQTLRGLTLHINEVGKRVHFQFSPAIPFGAGKVRASVNGRTVQAKLETHEQDQHVEVDFDAPMGESVVKLEFQGGVGIDLPAPSPMLGDKSRTLKISLVKMADRQLVMKLDVIPAEGNSFELRTERNVIEVKGAVSQKIGEDVYRLTLPPQEGREYESREIVVNFKK